eukprot:7314037-Prorocentrum_lima.AAC.1
MTALDEVVDDDDFYNGLKGPADDEKTGVVAESAVAVKTDGVVEASVVEKSGVVVGNIGAVLAETG